MNLANAATRSRKGMMLEGVGFVITLITRDETVWGDSIKGFRWRNQTRDSNFLRFNKGSS